jgi:hydroxymethylglutaryl-CoA reductase
MKMHLKNILNHLKANDEETLEVTEYFEDKVISFSEVRAYLDQLRIQSAGQIGLAQK